MAEICFKMLQKVKVCIGERKQIKQHTSIQLHTNHTLTFQTYSKSNECFTIQLHQPDFKDINQRPHLVSGRLLISPGKIPKGIVWESPPKCILELVGQLCHFIPASIQDFSQSGTSLQMYSQLMIPKNSDLIPLETIQSIFPSQ